MQFHFNTEESMMRKYNYELIEEHKKLHDDLKEKVTGYIELYFLGNYSFIEELEEVVQEWIYEHILEEDRKYKEFFKNKHITF
jgi:hemerythrin-like metal-binding protein